LIAAAAQLRHIAQEDAAGLAEALRFALARFAKRSVSANRRAQQLNRGLNAALKTLQAIGVQESGRLIAEA
jgi:3-deoxy-D-arabino-heptulosonate 7-phosphate (DAHP) synthase class II